MSETEDPLMGKLILVSPQGQRLFLDLDNKVVISTLSPGDGYSSLLIDLFKKRKPKPANRTAEDASVPPVAVLPTQPAPAGREEPFDLGTSLVGGLPDGVTELDLDLGLNTVTHSFSHQVGPISFDELKAFGATVAVGMQHVIILDTDHGI